MLKTVCVCVCVWGGGGGMAIDRRGFRLRYCVWSQVYSMCEYYLKFLLCHNQFYSDLNEHVSSAGLKGPMLVKGDAGFGKSLLLAKW